MILLRTSYIGTDRTGSSSNIILNCNLVRLEVYMVKLCHEKVLILRCILPKETEPPPEKKITSHPLEILNTLIRNSTHWE